MGEPTVRRAGTFTVLLVVSAVLSTDAATARAATKTVMTAAGDESYRVPARSGYMPLDNDGDNQINFVKASRPQLLVANNHDVTTLGGIQPNEAGLFRHVDGPAASVRWTSTCTSGSPRLVRRTGSRRGR